LFSSIDDVKEKLRANNYIPDTNIATVVYLAAKLGKPVLVEGPAGVGKTELSKVLAAALDRELVRLQCYEGLDEAKALYEWEYGKQLLYTQILKDKIQEITGGAKTLSEAVDRIAKDESVFFSERFILPRPLLHAITSEKPTVLLIDEVDKSDPEFEAFLLEILSDFQVTVPELGTVKAKHMPLVFLTSNNAREMSDALKRRCLHLFIDFPNVERESEIVRLKVPEAGPRLADDVTRLVHHIRKLDLKKTPSISETLDWAKSLTLLNADLLDQEVVDSTLSVILKFEADIIKAREEVKNYIARKKSEAANTAAAANPREDFLN
jgi:MoxR-like ATPase